MTVSDGDVAVATLADLIESSEAAGVVRVDAALPAGSHTLPAPPVIDWLALDEALHETMRNIRAIPSQTYGPLYATVFQEAMVVGQGSVITRDARLVRESAAEFVAPGNPPDGFEKIAPDMLRMKPGPTRRIEGCALLLKRPWWRNYGHWLVDSASILAIASRLRLPPRWQVIVGAQEVPAMRAVVEQTMGLLAPDVPVREHRDEDVFVVDELFYVSPMSVPPLFKRPEGLVMLAAAVSRRSIHHGAAYRRLFVSRGDHPSRRLWNEIEIIGIARAEGYDVVYPEQLSLQEQANLFRSAISIVGVKGAALTNIIFCAAGASVLVLSPSDFVDPFFIDLAAHAGVTYSELYGPLVTRERPASYNPFTVDPEKFSALLPK